MALRASFSSSSPNGVDGQPARVAGVAVGHLGRRLGPREGDLRGVHDDHEVAHVHVGGKRRLVLAAEEVGGLDGEASQDHVGGVDDEPLSLDVSGLGAVRAHGCIPFLVRSSQRKVSRRRCFPSVRGNVRLLTNTARFAEPISAQAPGSASTSPVTETSTRETADAAGVATSKSTAPLAPGQNAEISAQHGYRVRAMTRAPIGWP